MLYYSFATEFSMGSDSYFLFVDDSGSSCLDHANKKRADGMDAFALGGFIIEENKVEEVKNKHKLFMLSHGLECPNHTQGVECASPAYGFLCPKYIHELKCPFTGNHYPLHSTKIRGRKKYFNWLKNKEKAKLFYPDLEQLITSLPIIVHACVIHRPKYQELYATKYENKWQLCRSAYQILIERAVKYVKSVGGRKLIVYVEHGGRKEDDLLNSYHLKLLEQGMEFDTKRSSSYQPISSDELSKYLAKKIRFQTKKSRLMQLADIVLYPIVKAGYEPSYPPYIALSNSNLLLDYHVEDVKSMGIKYYCFEK